MKDFIAMNGKWDKTGCFHRAGLYNPTSKEFIVIEDIGRHNCVDKLKGHTVINNINISEYYLFITARITSSLYQKIRRAGINTIISRSAITSASLTSARKDDITLAAFCRPEEDRVTLFHNGMQTLKF